MNARGAAGAHSEANLPELPISPMPATQEEQNRSQNGHIINEPTGNGDQNANGENGQDNQPRDTVINFDNLLNRPLPQGKKARCKIIRKVTPLRTTYELYLEGSRGPTFLLFAWKKATSKTTNFRISSQKDDFSTNPPAYRGKVRANFSGTVYTGFDNGSRPSKSEKGRCELVSIMYEPNAMGFQGPRKLTLLLPGITVDSELVKWCPQSKEERLYEQYKRGNQDILVLQNKTPHWSEESQSFVLNFSGRVSVPSVKNFQIIHEKDPDYVVMQFGRFGEHEFTLDFQFPMTCLQAFAVALSSFDYKIACE